MVAAIEAKGRYDMGFKWCVCGININNGMMALSALVQKGEMDLGDSGNGLWLVDLTR